MWSVRVSVSVSFWEMRVETVGWAERVEGREGRGESERCVKARDEISPIMVMNRGRGSSQSGYVDVTRSLAINLPPFIVPPSQAIPHPIHTRSRLSPSTSVRQCLPPSNTISQCAYRTQSQPLRSATSPIAAKERRQMSPASSTHPTCPLPPRPPRPQYTPTRTAISTIPTIASSL